jgi:hypothetical protein
MRAIDVSRVKFCQIRENDTVKPVYIERVDN